MSYTSLTYSVDDRIATICLNKPDRRNALDGLLIRELTDAFMLANRTAQVRVVILTGAGPAFCAGMDLDYLSRTSLFSQEETLEDARSLARLLQLVSGLRKIVIAQLNGPAIGGGCGLAAACDYVYAAKSAARLGAPEVKLGFVPAVILAYLMNRMGAGRAREFVLQGEVLDASAACECGLVTKVIPDAELESAVREFAVKLAVNISPSSVTLTKDLFVRFMEMNPKEALEYATTINALARRTDDFRKGIEAILKKEKPEW
jgi:methylglutaconyl-CoA hydratase